MDGQLPLTPAIASCRTPQLDAHGWYRAKWEAAEEEEEERMKYEG